MDPVAMQMNTQSEMTGKFEPKACVPFFEGIWILCTAFAWNCVIVIDNLILKIFPA